MKYHKLEKEPGNDFPDDIFFNLPEIQAGKDLWQNKFHQYDVLEHTQKFVECLSEFSKDRNVRAAGWLHDIGKSIVAIPKISKDGLVEYSIDGKKYHTFPNHEIVGEEMVKKMDPKIFKEFDLDQEKIASLVGCHYLPMKGIKVLRKSTSFHNFKIAFNHLEQVLGHMSVSQEEVLDMFIADSLSKGMGCSDREELLLVRETLLKNNNTDEDLLKIYQLQRKI